jgi:hypothetical protein
METTLIYGLIAIVVLVVWMSLAARLGYNPGIGFLAIIPVVNLIAIGYMAFAESPNETTLRRRDRQPARGMRHDDEYPEFFRGI